MNNVIKFLVYLLVILLLVSWLITVGKSCSSTETNPQQTMEVMRDRTDSASDMMEDMESPDFTEELESILDEEEANVEEANTATTKKPTTEIDNQDNSEVITPATAKPEEQKEQKEVEKTPPPSKPKTSTSVGKGKFLVIAGSYIHPDNADRQSKKLSDKGYTSEVVSFELSEYHTVLAGRYDSYDAAQNTVNRLSKDGFDAYVKRRTR